MDHLAQNSPSTPGEGILMTWDLNEKELKRHRRLNPVDPKLTIKHRAAQTERLKIKHKRQKERKR